MSKAKWENNGEIKIFREYLRIPSVHPNVDYSMFFMEYFKAQSKLTSFFCGLQLPAWIF